MQTRSTIAKLQRHGLKVEKVDNKYFASSSSHVITFHDQDGTAICLCVTRHGAQDNIQEDYFAGSFVGTIKTALKIARVI